ncbi:hypothetical protein BJV74DRAFT_831851 [Russula compacta]|nr:hypothetical protein BJV74DRAFT_831851 [Russula compacta]
MSPASPRVVNQRDIIDGSEHTFLIAAGNTDDDVLLVTLALKTSVLPTKSSSDSRVASQTSPPAQSSATSDTATRPSPTSSPVTSSSVPSSVSVTSSTASTTLPSSSVPIVTATSNDATATFTSVLAAPASQSPTPTRAATPVSFLQNKPAVITVVSIAGLFVLAAVFVLGTVTLRRRRHSRLAKEAMVFSPTTLHSINVDDDGSGGIGNDDENEKRRGLTLPSRSDGQSRLKRSRHPGGSHPAPSVPAMAPSPMPVVVALPAPRETQQQGPRMDLGRPYANSAHPYYSAGNPQWQWQQQQRQQQQQQQQQHWPYQEQELPLAPVPPSDAVRHPSVLMPMYHLDPAGVRASRILFATAAQNPPPLGAGSRRTSETWGSDPRTYVSTRTHLPPTLEIPDTTASDDESVYSGITEDRRMDPRTLKVVNA